MLMQSGAESLSVPDQQEVVTTCHGFDVIQQDALRHLAEAWSSARQGDGFPSRRDLDPTQFPRLLPHLYILDREPPPVHWRYRLAGVEIHQSLQRMTMKGCGLDEVISSKAISLVSKRWASVGDRGVAIYMSGPIYRDSESYRLGGRLLLPLSESRDRSVTGLVGASLKLPLPAERPEGVDLNVAHIIL